MGWVVDFGKDGIVFVDIGFESVRVVGVSDESFVGGDCDFF